MKKAYFATICFAPIVVLLVGLTLSRLSLNLGGFSSLMALYEGVGMFVILVDLWRSERSVVRKIIWTVPCIRLPNHPWRFLIVITAGKHVVDDHSEQTACSS